MNFRFWKKKKLPNDLSMEELNENFAVFQYERERLHAAQIDQALKLDEKRDKDRYVR